MSKTIRKSAIAVAVLAAAPFFAQANSAEMSACYEAFVAEHLPAEHPTSLQVLPGGHPALSSVSFSRTRTVEIDLQAADPESGNVIASATCTVRPNGTLSITPRESRDFLAAN